MKYKYCPVCASALSTKEDHGLERLVCAKCGFVFYQNSKPTASTIIYNDRNEVLLSRRSINPYLGKWDIVGGFLENGEDPIVGAKREAREEIGVEVEVGDLIFVCVDKYGEAEEFDFYTFNLFYKAKIASGEPMVMEEASEIRWFAQKNIPWGELAFENGTMALKAFFKL
jgi:ADP-ribose pyrophosphatase YjhB (NUDIX family)